MPLSTINLQWLDHNGQRAYPFSELANRVDESGSFTIPNSLLLSVYLPIAAGVQVDFDKFFLRSLDVFAVGMSLELHYSLGNRSVRAALASIPFARHSPFKSYALSGVDDFANSQGRIVVGRLTDLTALPAGSFRFSLQNSSLVSDCIRPSLRGVTSITVVNGVESSGPLYGDIILKAGASSRLTVSSVSGSNTIRYDAINGEGLNNSCDCADNEVLPCIKTINTVRPNPSGDFFLQGNECIEISNIANGLLLEDLCSTPCCGPEELDKLVPDLNKLSVSVDRLERLAAQLESQMQSLTTNILASRIGSSSPCSG